MITDLMGQSILTVIIFFLFLMICAAKEIAPEKSLAVSGLWTALFVIFWQDLPGF